MKRIFHVRLNLDELSAHNDTFATDEERGQWLRGFLVAARGGANRFILGSPAALGYEVGAAALGHAKQFAADQSAKGQASAAARKANHCSTTVEPRLNQTSTTVEPNVNLSNNRIIDNPISQKTINQNPNEEKASKSPLMKKNPVRDNPPSVQEVAEYVSQMGYGIDPQEFHDHNTRGGWTYGRAGKSLVQDWRAHVRTAESLRKRWAADRQPKEPWEQLKKEQFDQCPQPDLEYLRQVEMAAREGRPVP